MQGRILRVLLGCVAVHASCAVAVVPESGIYVDPLRPGTGFVIEMQANRIAFSMSAYAEDGEPEYFVSGGELRRAASPGNSGEMHVYSGTLFRSRNGFLPGDRRAFVPPAGHAVERVGEVSLLFDHLQTTRLVLVLDRPAPMAQAYAEYSLLRQPFGYAGIGTSGSASLDLECALDLRGDWIFVDTADASVPPLRFNFTEVQNVPGEQRCPAAVDGPVQVRIYRDVARAAELRCIETPAGQPDPLDGRRHTDGCELRAGGGAAVVLSFSLNDVGLKRIAGSYGPLQEPQQPRRGDGRILGLRVE